MQGMSLSVNAVSEVREFTTTTGRTVYVLDGMHGFDLDALIAACTSRACAPPPVGRGGSLPSGGSRLPNGADPEKWAARAMKLRNANGVVGIEGYKSMSAAEYTTYVKSKTLQEKWERAVPNDPRVRMRVDAYVLRAIMQDGRFKTQHETGTSGGHLSPETRDRFEEEVFATKSPRPKYGYVAKADDPFGPGERALSDVVSSALDDYGNIVVEFKRDVERRTSVTVGDSLMAESEKIAPIMLDDIADASWERRAAAMSIETPMYTEAQIHGDLSLDDVARIIVTETDYEIDEMAEVLLDLESKYPGIEIVVLDGDDLSSFSACEEHGEFACTSKACAPPPVGRGGSLPTRLSRGVQVEVPVGRLWDALVLGARGDKSALVDLFSEYVMAGHVPYYTPTRKAGRSWSTSDATAKRFAWDKVYDGSMVGESNGRHVARKVGRTWTIRIPLVLRGRPEIGKSDDWTDASSRDLNWWAEQEGEVRISKDAKIKLDNVSVALPSRKQLERILAMDNPREIIDIFGGEDTSPWVDLDMPLVLTASVCVEHGEFACTSRACAPPPVGRGGSLPTAVQHVTSREAAALIKSGGFIVGRGQMHGSLFGNGIYLSMAGDKFASDLYRSGTRKEGHEAALVKGTVQLKRPLRVSGNSKDEVGKDIVEKLGGAKGVRDAATKSYERLRDGAKKALKAVLGEDAVEEVDWDDEFETDPVFNDMTPQQYARFIAAIEPYMPHGIPSFGSLGDIETLRRMMSFDERFVSSRLRSIGNLIADLGYDGIEVTNPKFSAEVGGSQIVVFDPKAITVESVEDFGALIERFGIEVTLDYAPEVFACIEHGEFACTSRACAPPPVGTGGSLKSGSGAVERWTGGEATVAIAPKSKRSLTLDDIHSTWPRDRSEVMKLLGDAEPYPDGYKISTEQDLSRFVVSSRWIKIGGSVVPVLRKVAAEVIKDGIDRVASAENMVGESAEVNVVRLHVARVLTAIRSAPKSTVWRGMRVSQEVLDQLKVGSVYSEVLATATGRRKLAENFARGKFGSVGQKRSGTVQVLLKMNARNLPIGGNPTGDLVDLADERFISGKFRVVSVSKVRSTHIIEVEQIDGD